MEVIFSSLSGAVSMVMMHVWFIGLRGHIGEIAGKSMVRPLFLLFCFFCGFGVLSSGICGLVEPSTLGPLTLLSILVLKSSMYREWLTHGDLALEARG